MTLDALGDLNWLAVVVAAIAFFALGAVWYATPVFGKLWASAMGWDPPADYKPSPAGYIVPAITCFVSTVAIALLAVATKTDTVSEAIVLALVGGAGLAGAAIMVTGFFDPMKPKPVTHALINAGYQVVGLLIVSVIVALWQ